MVVHALEALALMAERRTHTVAWANPTRQRLRFARCCYGHLAGQLGMKMFSQLLSKEWLAPVGDGDLLTAGGQAGLDALVFAVDGLLQSKSANPTRTAYRCLDWSERRDHIAGNARRRCWRTDCSKTGCAAMTASARWRGNAAGAQAPGGLDAVGE